MSDRVENLNEMKLEDEVSDSCSSIGEVISPDPYDKSGVGNNDDDKNFRGQVFLYALRAKHYDRVAEENKRVGSIVAAISDGVTHRGRVTEYDAERDLFKVLYEDGRTRYINKAELIRTLAPRDLINSHAFLPRNNGKRQKLATGKEESAFSLETNSATKKEEPKTNRTRSRRARRPRINRSSYVPLAVRERKRDDYYWY